MAIYSGDNWNIWDIKLVERMEYLKEKLTILKQVARTKLLILLHSPIRFTCDWWG